VKEKESLLQNNHPKGEMAIMMVKIPGSQVALDNTHLPNFFQKDDVKSIFAGKICVFS